MVCKKLPVKTGTAVSPQCLPYHAISAHREINFDISAEKVKEKNELWKRFLLGEKLKK
jgi:hypothetical protein